MPGREDEEAYEFGFVVLTRRLILRTPRDEDDAAMAALAANPFVAENLAAAPRPLAGESGECFVVLEREKRATVGAVAYGPMVDRRASVEVAAWIGEPFWGNGFATEATQAVIDRAFADNRVNLLWCSNRAGNHRARRVIEKCGFQFRETGMVRSPALRGALPVERFVLERRNWRSLKAWGAGRVGGQGQQHASHDNAA
jgi:RimJ/RimL family protein N-acetyltransferase